MTKNTITPEKIQRQLELEHEGVQLGIARYRKQLAETPLSEMPPGLVLMHRSIAPMREALERFLEPSRGGARLHEARRFITRFDLDEVAFITARTILNSLSTSDPIQRVAIRLVNTLIDHLEYTKFRSTHPGLVEAIERNLKTSHERHRRTVLMRAKRKYGVEDEDLSDVDKVHTGVKLIELFIEATGLVRRVQLPTSQWILEATPETTEWIERQHARCELLHPVYMPMIIPPRDWTGPYGGGFWSNEATHRFKLVKTRNKEYLERLEDHNMPLVYRTVNALQRTPWRINRRVLEVAQEAWRLDNGIAGLPMDEEEPLPPKPWSSDEEYEYLKEHDIDVIRDWKRRATEVYDRRISTKSKRFQVVQKLWLADKFKDEEEIYFVWTLDWRGRLYPVQHFVNPQADDLGRALLMFAEGKPLGDRGAYWLAIHLANSFGVDKVSFDERIQWVREHEDLILDSAKDPLGGQRFWTEADDPWQFLAACFEWLGYKEEGPSFVSHLPIALDGTCNGLQNFSGLLRDEIGGKVVNLVPSEKPQDVYSEVAKVVSKMVEEDAAKGDEMAKVWVGKIDRNIAKRPVMTVPYGVSKYGMREQLLEELRSRNKPGERYLDSEDDYGPCVYLADKMYDAIGAVVVAARSAMDWLQEVAKIASKAEIPLEWTTPAGFLVYQHYVKQKNKKIRTFWGAARVRVQLSVNEDTDKMDKNKQRNGISPNFVHSMDASHLMLTVNKCLDEGISSFAMIHDSYGTHACDTDTLARLLREAFVEQYEADPLVDWLEQIKRQLPEDLVTELPELPEYGDLDLSVVHDSLYFFA